MLSSRPAVGRQAICAVATAVAVLATSGCGTDLRPGVAASVNEETITESTIDDLTEAICAFNEIQRKEQGLPQPGQSVQELRASLVESLIILEITDQAAEERGVTVSDALVSKIAAGTVIPDDLAADHRALLEEFLKERTLQALQQGAIGANLEDPAVTTADKIDQSDVTAANSYLKKFAEQQDVEVSPRYGEWNGVRLEFGTGSLSDPVSTTPAPTPPPGQPAPPEPTFTPPASQLCG